jgi:hypothetical protein
MRSSHRGVVTSSVLASRPVEGNTVSQLIDNQTLLPREVHLDGQGRFNKSSRQDPKAAYG